MKNYHEFVAESILRRSPIGRALLGENLSPKLIDPRKFPNPLPSGESERFLTKGLRDGQRKDDRIRAEKATVRVSSLKPSQTAVYLGKSLSMAISGVKGGDLGSIISGDDYILDGHHRWAATMFNDPTATVTGIRVNMRIGDLIPVLRAVGDAYGNARQGQPAGGDVNIFVAKPQDVLDCLKGKNMDPKFFDKDKTNLWLQGVGGIKTVVDRLRLLQKVMPPRGAPPRIQMPVIRAEKGEHVKVANDLMVGKIDVKIPYAKQ